MTAILDTLQADPRAAAFGALGLACQLAWPLFTRRRAMLAVQLGIGTNYGVQYALLGAWSGSGICFIGATQTLIALAAGDRPWLRRMGLVFLPVVALVSALTWSGLASLLAFCACSLVMLGRMQPDTLRLRALLLAAAPFGIGHDLSVGALPALCGAISSAVIAAAMLRREIRRRRGLAHPAGLSARAT